VNPDGQDEKKDGPDTPARNILNIPLQTPKKTAGSIPMNHPGHPFSILKTRIPPST
jgi:hypothetical protein